MPITCSQLRPASSVEDALSQPARAGFPPSPGDVVIWDGTLEKCREAYDIIQPDRGKQRLCHDWDELVADVGLSWNIRVFRRRRLCPKRRPS